MTQGFSEEVSLIEIKSTDKNAPPEADSGGALARLGPSREILQRDGDLRTRVCFRASQTDCRRG